LASSSEKRKRKAQKHKEGITIQEPGGACKPEQLMCPAFLQNGKEEQILCRYDYYILTYLKSSSSDKWGIKNTASYGIAVYRKRGNV